MSLPTRTALAAFAFVSLFQFLPLIAFADNASDCVSVEDSENSTFRDYRDSLERCYPTASNFYELIGTYNGLCQTFCRAVGDSSHAQIADACQSIKNSGDQLQQIYASRRPQCAH